MYLHVPAHVLFITRLSNQKAWHVLEQSAMGEPKGIFISFSKKWMYVQHIENTKQTFRFDRNAITTGMLTIIAVLEVK